MNLKQYLIYSFLLKLYCKSYQFNKFKKRNILINFWNLWIIAI